MFSFSLRGVIVGMNSSKDGQTTFLKVKPEAIDGVRVQEGETLGNLDVACDKGALGAGVGFSQSVNVDGFGYIGVRHWDPKDGRKPRDIENTHLLARAVKLAK